MFLPKHSPALGGDFAQLATWNQEASLFLRLHTFSEPPNQGQATLQQCRSGCVGPILGYRKAWAAPAFSLGEDKADPWLAF